MDGDIQVTSVHGSGTTFTLLLPPLSLIGDREGARVTARDAAVH